MAAAVALGWLLATLPLSLAALFMLGVAGGLALLAQPALVFLLLPLAVPFGELRPVAVGGLTAGGVEALLAGVSLVWLARGLARREVRVPRAPLLLPVLVFLAALVLSLPGAESLPAAVKEIVKWGEILAAYLLVVALADEAEVGRGRFLAALALTLLLAASLEALSGILQSVRRVGPPSYAILGGRLWRAFGEFGQPNPFGGYINLTLLPVLSGLMGLALGGTFPAPTTPRIAALRTPFRRHLWGAEGGRGMEEGRPKRAYVFALWAILLSAATLLSGALVLSWSRGAWFGALAGGPLVVVLWLALTLARPAPDRAEATRRRALGGLAVLLIVAILLVLAGAANVVPSGVTSRFESVREYFGGFDVLNVEVTDDNFAVVERVAHWYAAAAMWADHFWTGVGAGNYATAYPRYNVPRWTDPLGHAHNYYLNIGAEAGFIGLLAYGLLLSAAVVSLLRVAARRTDWATRALAIGALGALAALAVHSLFDNLYVHSMGVHLAILLGLVAAADARPR